MEVSEHMPCIRHDGGRAAAGFVGTTGDCVVRSVAIASGRPYREVYEALSEGCKTQRVTKRGKAKASARDGVNVTRKWFKDYMAAAGFVWVPTMQIGTGCRVHLVKGELPMGRLVVSVSKHYTAVVDGVIYDTHNPQRRIHWRNAATGQIERVSERCVYGYWQKA
jgi:hypothetical protein